MAITDYSATPSSNTTVGGINIAENCAPAGINNAIRQIMADLKVQNTAIRADVLDDVTVTAAELNRLAGVTSGVQGQIDAFSNYTVNGSGDAPLLANLDATTMGPGRYRFDATTTGTFPTGMTASQTGIVDVIQQSTAVKYMFIRASNSDKFFDRRLQTTWQPWTMRVSVPGTGVRGDMVVYDSVTWKRLPIGTVGKSPVSDGTDIVMSSPGLIIKETGLSGLAQKDIALPAGFSVYRLVIWDLLPATTGSNIQVRVSTDGGATFVSTGTYTSMGSFLAASSPNAGAISNTTTGTAGQITGALANTAGKEAFADLTLIPGASAFVMHGRIAYETNLSTDGVHAFSRIRQASASVNAIRLFASSGNIGLSYSLSGVA